MPLSIRAFMKIFKSRNIVVASACLLCFSLGGFISTTVDEKKITAGLVKQAQTLLGLEFTDAEADSMLKDLDDQRKNLSAIRKLEIPNSVSPALNFNPLPVGYQFPDKANYFKPGEVSEVSLSVDREELAFYN